MTRRDERPGCGGSGPVCQRSSGLIRSPGLQEEEATHQAGSYNRLEDNKRKEEIQLINFIPNNSVSVLLNFEVPFQTINIPLACEATQDSASSN